MAEKRLMGKVSIPVECAKWFRYVARNGEVWAVKPTREPMPEEERQRRNLERETKKREMQKLRAAYRDAVKSQDISAIQSALKALQDAERH